MKMFKLSAAIALAATAMISHSSATTIYTSQAVFLAHTQSGSYLETFDSLPQFTPLNSPLSFSKNGFSYTASAPSADNQFFNAGTTGDVWLSTFDHSTNIVFDFTSNNVTAVGGNFFLTDIPGNVVAGTITVTLDNGTTFSVSDPSATSFVGFTTSSPIHSLTFIPPPSGANEVFGTVNNFITGRSVPDSGSTLPLIGIALASIGLLRRKLVA
jgi:VPDSG-CTERM motif